MLPHTHIAATAALALVVTVGASLGQGLGLGGGTAAAQWLVSPPLDTPPKPQRPPESYRRQAPQGAPGESNATPEGPQEGDGNAAGPPAGCPFNDGKLELVV